MKKLISLLLAAITVTAAIPSVATVFAVESSVAGIAEEAADSEQTTTPVNASEGTEISETSETAVLSETSETTAISEASEASEASETSATEESSPALNIEATTEPEETESSEIPTAATQSTAESTAVSTEASSQSESRDPTDTSQATAPSQTQATTAPAPSATQATQPATEKKLYPAAVKGFKVEKKSTKAVRLGWKKSTKNTTHYEIYRSSENSKGTFSGYKKLKTISNIDKVAFTDKNLKSGYVYKYKIYAVNKTKTYTVKSGAASVKAVVKLLAPKTVKAKKATTTYITLKWSKVSGARKYLIYRKDSGSKEILLAKTDKNTYTDTKITSGTTYKYKVKGYRVVSKKAYKGPANTLTVASGITSVSGVTAKSCLNRALLTWTPVNGADGYDVFVINSKGEYKLKETRKYATYLSGKCKTGKTIKFAVKAFKKVNGDKTYSGTKFVTVTISDKAYGKKPSGTWVEVCTETQEMFMFVNNKLYCKTPVVTGNAGALATTHGYHKVLSRKSPAVLRGSNGGSSWTTNVTFWLGFTYDGQGIHDSTWRTSGYGGEIYKGNGSHGCVNTPYAAAAKIYAKAYAGMPVIVY